MYIDFSKQPYIMITIESWDYMVIRQPDDGFRVWHQVTPADGGYGTQVDILLPADYFRTHSAKQFYAYIAPMQNFRPRPACLDKQGEIRELTQRLRSMGWVD